MASGMRTHRLLSMATVAAALALGGCAVAPTAPSVMVLPGSQKGAAEFQADNAACQQHAQALLAGDTQAINDQAVASAAIGAAIGATAGALLGHGGYSHQSAAWGAGTGLMFGSAVGAGNSQVSSYGLQRRFDIAFMQCMYVRGNQIPGQVSYRRQAPAVAPPPPNRPPPIYSPPNSSPPSSPAPNYPPPNTPPPVGTVPPA